MVATFGKVKQRKHGGAATRVNCVCGVRLKTNSGVSAKAAPKAAAALPSKKKKVVVCDSESEEDSDDEFVEEEEEDDDDAMEDAASPAPARAQRSRRGLPTKSYAASMWVGSDEEYDFDVGSEAEEDSGSDYSE